MANSKLQTFRPRIPLHNCALRVWRLLGKPHYLADWYDRHFRNWVLSQREATNQDTTNGLVAVHRSLTSIGEIGSRTSAADFGILYYVEHTACFGANTGLQRVVRMLARGLQEQNCSVIYVKWSRDTDTLVVCDAEDVKHLSSWNGPMHSEPELAFYRERGNQPLTAVLSALPGSWQLLVPEVTHITSFRDSNLTDSLVAWSRQGGVPISFLFYDDIPLHRDELRHLRDVHAQYMQSLAKADGVFSISAFSNIALKNFWKGSSELEPLCRPKAIPLPAESILAPRHRPKPQEPRGKNILSVGSITPHKNQIALCEAFSACQARGRLAGWRLILAGHCATESLQRLSQLITANSNIVHLPGVTDEKLCSLYASCAFTVFPSTTEGFGLPVVESLWFGKPSICHNSGAPGEIAEYYSGCLAINASDGGQLQSALTQLGEGPEALSSLTLSIAHQTLPTWSDYTHRVLDELDRIHLTHSKPSRPWARVRRVGKRQSRVFWLGMHKVLVQTELCRLRTLGFEVFNPPYLSDIQDQSAELDWNNRQATSLPKPAFKELATTNFFYEDVSSRIADILNSYFDQIIVTISPTWLKTILKAYDGPVVYRTYGQSFKISTELNTLGISEPLAARPAFRFLPHTRLSLDEEAEWLATMAQEVPYCLTDDVFGYQDSWDPKTTVDGDVGLTCPNIANPYYEQHYHYLKTHYSAPCFRMFGVQTNEVTDPCVVGTLPRHVQLERFRHLACYLYTYKDKNVCYLPPIEAMVMGVPVVFPAGCLLDRYFGDRDAPGRYSNELQASELVGRIRSGDQELISSIIESQNTVRRLYTPSYVWPVFDKRFQQLFATYNHS